MELAFIPALRRPLRSESKPDPLREQLAKYIENAALAMLDPARIEARAEDLRIVHRHRVHHAGLIVDAMLLSAMQRSTDTEGRFLDAQRTYEQIGGALSGKTSFRNNVLKLVPVMEDLLQRRLAAMAESTQEPELRGRLASFADVLIPDGCAFKLAAALSNVYAGTGQPAELKLHAVYSVRRGGCTSIEKTEGSVHDSDGFWPRWERGALYLWDLGYTSNERFIDAIDAGSHVLQRLKSSGNPVVIASYSAEGHRRGLLDEEGGRVSLNDACALGLVHKQRLLDLDVEIKDGKRRKRMARIVCVPFGGEDRYYLTTLPREIFPPHDVAELYRVRWEVELFFRGWKGALRLDEVRRLECQESIHAAITASLLASVFSQAIHRAVEHLEATMAAEKAAISP